jgi:hypothetical protein
VEELEREKSELQLMLWEAQRKQDNTESGALEDLMQSGGGLQTWRQGNNARGSSRALGVTRHELASSSASPQFVNSSSRALGVSRRELRELTSTSASPQFANSMQQFNATCGKLRDVSNGRKENDKENLWNSLQITDNSFLSL